MGVRVFSLFSLLFFFFFGGFTDSDTDTLLSLSLPPPSSRLQRGRLLESAKAKERAKSNDRLNHQHVRLLLRFRVLPTWEHLS